MVLHMLALSTELGLGLTLDDFEPGEDVYVGFEGDRTKKRLRPSPTVLMAEFCERFDRTFLPVAELEVR